MHTLPSDILRASRVAWWGGWVAFASLVLVQGRLVDVELLRDIVLVASLCGVVALARAWLQVTIALTLIATIAPIAPVAPVAMDAATYIVALSSSVMLTWLMRSKRAARVRFAMHAFSFFGTFAIALPWFASAPAPIVGDVLAGTLIPAALVGLVEALAATLVVVGTVIVALAAATLLSAGGTADPFDPPAHYQTGGIYALIRHPMQLGEIAIVVGASLALGTLGALLCAVTFTVVLVGPLRRFEERWLARRYHRQFHEHRARVRGFLPTPNSPLATLISAPGTPARATRSRSA